MILRTFTKLQAIISTRPTLVILGILVGAMLLFAMYLASPFYVQVQTAAVVQALDTQESRWILAAAYAAPAIVYIIGIIRHSSSLLKRSAQMIFAVYLFAAILRIISVGLFPVFWLYLLGLALIAGVIWVSWELKSVERIRWWNDH